jgi:hypothetical protein
MLVEQARCAEASVVAFVTRKCRIGARRRPRKTHPWDFVAGFLPVAEKQVVALRIADAPAGLRIGTRASLKIETSGIGLAAAQFVDVVHQARRAVAACARRDGQQECRKVVARKCIVGITTSICVVSDSSIIFPSHGAQRYHILIRADVDRRRNRRHGSATWPRTSFDRGPWLPVPQIMNTAPHGTTSGSWVHTCREILKVAPYCSWH